MRHGSMTISTAVAYQATDLARNHREVLDAARRGGALIRDKDGLALRLAPADELDRERDIADLALDLVRAALAIFAGGAPASSFGDLGWVSVLPAGAQQQFFAEMAEALLLAASGVALRNVELLLGDWRATAESWADPETREQLLGGAPEPLHDIVL
jgi:hypothetical protein